MAVEQVAVSRIEVEDKPGALQEVLAGAAAAGASILHLAAFATGGGKGQAYFVADKPGSMKEYAGLKGVSLEEYTGFLLTGAEMVGAGAEVTGPLADAGVNLVLSTATVVGGEYFLLLVVKKSDAEAAAGALGA